MLSPLPTGCVARWCLPDPDAVHATFHHAARGSRLPPDFLPWAYEAERLLLAYRRRRDYAKRRRVG